MIGRLIFPGIFFALAAGVVAELLPGVDPSPPDPAGRLESLPEVTVAGAGGVGAGGVLVEGFSAMVVSGPGGAVGVEGDGVLRVGDGVLLPGQERLALLFEGWKGRCLREGDLVEMLDRLLVHYDRSGYPVVAVNLPVQDFADGVVRVVVDVGRYVGVAVSRPRHGSPGVVAEGLRLEPGELIRRDELEGQLWWMGRTLFRRPRLFASPAEGGADILIALEERRPWRVTAGFDNANVPELGEERVFVGAAGLLPNEHLLGWQTVSGAPVSGFSAHAMSWEVPFSRARQTLTVEAAYAEVSTSEGVLGQVLESEGKSWSAAMTQRVFLPVWGGWRHRAGVGLEVRGTDQFLLFGGAGFSPGEVRMAHLRLVHDIQREWASGAVGLEGVVLASPGGLVAGNDDGSFRAYDSEADSSYLAARLQASGWWSPGGDWRIGGRVTGQWADSRLLPSEQFAVGGHQTVRGVEERAVFGDGGWHASVELLSPAVRWGRAAGGVRFVGFIDHAETWREGGSGESLSGAGLGVRVRWRDGIDLRLDQGWRLDAAGGQTHFGVVINF